MDKSRVYLTGIGIISSIGNDTAEVARSLSEMQHGFTRYPKFDDNPLANVELIGSVKGFDVESTDFEDWKIPDPYRIRREVLRGLAPHGVYAYCAMEQAIADAGLSEEDISNPETGIYTSSAGSPLLLHSNLVKMDQHGPMRCSPTGIISSISGTLSFNLVAIFKIQGSSCGFSSACASSGHGIGFAFDEIAFGRQNRMFVAAGEDVNFESVLPFAGMRALSLQSEPEKASCPFDRDRNGFVSAGGGVVLVLESEAEVTRREVRPYAEILGWGQSSDGHNVAMSHPEGLGLSRAMKLALKNSALEAGDVDYINAHATSTTVGDISEGKAIEDVFSSIGTAPRVSSTKALTGHGLSLASGLEAAIVGISMDAGFTPGSAHIQNLDTQFEHLNIIRENDPKPSKIALSNSSGFGGANVSLAIKNCRS